MSDEHRLKIQNGNILNVLIQHVNGEREMSATQVSAAIALLKKVLPDLSHVEGSLEHQHSYVARLPAKAQTPKTWQEQHSPAPLQ